MHKNLLSHAQRMAMAGLLGLPAVGACIKPPAPAAAVVGGVPFKINSAPEGADVTVDGQSYATTPLSLILKPGTHLLKLSKSGYFLVTTTVTVPPEGGAFQGVLAASH